MELSKLEASKYFYTGIFSDERCLQFLELIQTGADQCMMELHQVAIQKAFPNKSFYTGVIIPPSEYCENYSYSAAFKAGLDTVENWSTKVLQEEIQKLRNRCTFVDNLYQYVVVRYLQELYRNDKPQKLSVTVPSIEQFLYQFYSNLAANALTRNLKYFAAYGLEKKSLMMDCIRMALFKLLEGQITLMNNAASAAAAIATRRLRNNNQSPPVSRVPAKIPIPAKTQASAKTPALHSTNDVHYNESKSANETRAAPFNTSSGRKVERDSANKKGTSALRAKVSNLVKPSSSPSQRKLIVPTTPPHHSSANKVSGSEERHHSSNEERHSDEKTIDLHYSSNKERHSRDTSHSVKKGDEESSNEKRSSSRDLSHSRNSSHSRRNSRKKYENELENEEELNENENEQENEEVSPRSKESSRKEHLD